MSAKITLIKAILIALVTTASWSAAIAQSFKVPFKKLQLENGLRVVISEDHSAPAVAVLYLALKKVSKKRTMPRRDWTGAMNQFAILFKGRIPIGRLATNPFIQNL